MSDESTTVVWFRNDLRVRDNPALADACAGDDPVVALFVLEDGDDGPKPLGGASRWWLHHSLASLKTSLAELKIPLVLVSGAAKDAVPRLADRIGASRVCWNRRYEPGAIATDKTIKSALEESGIEVRSHNGSLLCEPWTVATGQGTPYRVFTPFWRAAREKLDLKAPLEVPTPRQKLADPAERGERLEEWSLLPQAPNWASGFQARWEPGEKGAAGKLTQFLEDALKGYGKARDIPSEASTSLLSPHLRFGEISPRAVWHAVDSKMSTGTALDRDGEKFLSELGWREFAYHLLFHFPETVKSNFNRDFDAFDWRSDDKQLSAWQEGRTGYPIVDAGMRELWATGYMHNRVRMIAASFLTKHLRLHWHEGEAWFWDTLVDADPASNVSNWQWVAGTGADAAPYFRIFNPILQGEKFDAEGDYVRKWVPEVAELPNKAVHKPWTADSATLSDAGIELGRDYPRPIVDHPDARAAALSAFKNLKT